MNTKNISWTFVIALLVYVCAGAQGQETKPASAATAKPKAEPVEAKEFSAEVIEVKGLVERSVIEAGNADATAVKWTPVKQGETLGGGTQIRTGLRAHLVLRFGDASVVMVKRSTLASIDQFYREADTETIRLGLGYGAIRGGTTAGPVRSDFVVDSTVATLAKRGTEGWEFRVEPYTGRFRVSLAETGLVEALEKLTGQRRLVRPGEYANHANIGAMWVKQNIFNRTVHFFTAESVSGADLAFTTRNPDGLSVTGPGLGSETAAFSGRPQEARPGSRGDTWREQRPFDFDTLLLRPAFVVRPEGDFGLAPTFNVLLPESQRKAFNRAGRHNARVRNQLARRIAPFRRR